MDNEQSDLELFQKFRLYVQEKCLKQIKSDQQSLQAPVKPLETFINTVELSKALSILKIQKMNED